MLAILREKAVLTLVVLTILGVAVGALHDRALDRGAPFIVQEVVGTLLRPSTSGFHLAFSTIGRAARVSRPRRAILNENSDLRKEVLRLRTRNAILTEADHENARLRAALGLQQSSRTKLIAGEVISRKESNWFDTATIDRGRRAGIGKGWAVIATGWRLVGQILETDAYSSRMVALSDSNSAVGGMVQRSRSSGILQGQGGDYLTLAYLPKGADVKVGDVVISSGMGQVVPKGLIIGRVVKVVQNRVMGSTTALVRPSMRLDQVEQVFVLKPGQSVPQ